MLPLTLKVIWFGLSFSGIIVCWVVLCSFSRAIGSSWGPMLYSVFATLMQGIFCLGMIYDMDPFHMPKAFCIIQTFVIYYSAWSLTGVCAAFTFATSSTVLWPSSAARPGISTLGWKNIYGLPIFVFPLACLSISVPVLLNLNAIQPSEDLHCDASHPEWARFLGYAGFPMFLTIPCLFLSGAAARRVHQMHREIQRSYSYKYATVGDLQSRPRWDIERNVPPECVNSPTSLIDKAEMLDPASPTTTTGASPYDIPDVSTAFGVSREHSGPWEVLGSIEEEDELDPRRRVGSMVLSSSTPAAPPPKPNLAPAILRLILFQLVFFITQCLAALSTVIDVARHRTTPTPFGTQHVALILVGWGPAIVFGHLPAVRRQLMFWKR